MPRCTFPTASLDSAARRRQKQIGVLNRFSRRSRSYIGLASGNAMRSAIAT
jgi:ribosomal protein L34E